MHNNRFLYPINKQSVKKNKFRNIKIQKTNYHPRPGSRGAGEGDFADLLIVNQALEQQAKKLFSFDKKLQKKFPGFVVEKISRKDV